MTSTVTNTFSLDKRRVIVYTVITGDSVENGYFVRRYEDWFESNHAGSAWGSIGKLRFRFRFSSLAIKYGKKQ